MPSGPGILGPFYSMRSFCISTSVFRGSPPSWPLMKSFSKFCLTNLAFASPAGTDTRPFLILPNYTLSTLRRRYFMTVKQPRYASNRDSVRIM